MAFTDGGGTGITPEERLRQQRLLALNSEPGGTVTPGGGSAPGGAPIVGDTSDPEERRRQLLAQALGGATTEQQGLLSGGNPNLTTDPLGSKGSTAVSTLLGSAPSTAVQTATGTAPQSLEQQQALGSAPASTSVAAALGTNTVNPDTIAPGTPITGPTANTSTGSGMPDTGNTGGLAGPSQLLEQARSEPAPAGFRWENGRLVPDTTAPTGTGTGVTTTTGTSAGTGIVSGGGGGTAAGGTTTTVPTDDSRARLLEEAISKPPAGYHVENGVLVQDSATDNTQLPPALPPTGPGGGAGPGGAGAGTGNLGGGGSIDQVTNDLTSQLNEIQNQINAGNQPADVQVMYQQQLQQILAQIDAESTRLRQEAEAAGTSVDPATEFTLNKMREELDRQLKQSDMAANARGLFESGIRQASENELRKGNMSDQAMVLSTRLSKIKDDLTQSLRSLGGRKLDATERLGEQGITAQLTENRATQDRQASMQGQLLNARLGLRGQMGQEQSSRNQIAATQQEGVLNRAQQMQLQQLEQQYGDAQNKAKSTAEFEENRRQFEEQKQLITLKASYDTSGGGGGSNSSYGQTAGSNVSRPLGTTTLGNKELQDFSEAFSGQYAQDAIAAISQKENELTRDGLSPRDIQALYDYASKLQPRPTGIEAQKARAGRPD